MKKQYYICCVAGSSGMFLSSVFAKYLNLDCPTVISTNGHCHDLGSGVWQEPNEIELAGDFWSGKKSNKPIIFSHFTNLKKVKQVMPEVQIILINYNPDDVLQISTFRTMKAYTLMWSQTEYNKIAGPDWPLYDPNNLVNSKMIRDECIRFRIPDTVDWIQQVDKNLADYQLDFQTIVNGDIGSAVAKILNKPVDGEIEQFIKQYQSINRKFYNQFENES